MGIEDIQISEELETNAPSIKYSGNEGPKSPQEEMMMVDAMLEEEYEKYVFDLLEQRPDAQPMSIEEFKRMVIGDMSGGQPLPQDPTKPVNPFQPKPTGPVLPDRQMAAFGGIMGLDGRRQYGIGSSIKKRIRKLIPNEVAAIAEVAAPFVAPLNPALAAAMSGIGSFDRTGRIGSSLKSGIKNYAMGQLMRGIGGGTENLQANPFRSGASFGERFQGFGNASKMGSGFGKYFSNPIQSSGGIGEILADNAAAKGQALKDASNQNTVGKQLFQGNEADGLLDLTNINKGAAETPLGKLGSKIMEYVPTSFSDLKDPKKLLGTVGIFKTAEVLLGGPEEVENQIMNRGEGLDLAAIRKEVQEAFSDETGEKLKALRNKYPYLGGQDTKDIENMAMGGRIGYGLGSLVTESAVAQPVSGLLMKLDRPVQPGDPIGSYYPDPSGGLRDLSKELPMSNSGGMGGMLSKLISNNLHLFKNVSGQNNNSYNQKMYNQYFRDEEDFIDENFNNIDDREEGFMGSRISRAEGGLMDLGGMEKDYRAEGGFVPIGREEKADDVPARLSVNEFVFTADAVRNAGGGDIDRGAEVMENMMKHLEQGGQVSEESQGMQGARDMFATSQRLSEVI
jgi:uncharacterized short protein YbdD (DUF466 family)